jgi:uncharacterized membrane protein YhaH (DUF805 family)
MIDVVPADGWVVLFLPALLFAAAVSFLGAVVGLIFALVVLLPAFLLWLWILARICRKAGFSGWWALSTLFPPLFAAMIWLLAFTDWPGRPRVEIMPPRR